MKTYKFWKQIDVNIAQSKKYIDSNPQPVFIVTGDDIEEAIKIFEKETGFNFMKGFGITIVK